MTKHIDLVLASNSPRRRDLLALMDWQFAVHPADVDESLLPGETPGAYVIRLAREKAETCSAIVSKQVLILAADTTVALEGAILGKPRDAAEATGMLQRLRGQSHQVHTGIAILFGSQSLIDLCSTEVPMRAYSDEEIEHYVASGDPMDKAGAYAIQHTGFHPVQGITGCYASVMGLPLCHVSRNLTKIGIHAPDDLPARCQAILDYTCKIHVAVLNGDPVG